MKTPTHKNYLSIDALERPGLLSHLVLWCTLLIVLVAIVWANFAQLDEITRAEGRVIPSSQVQVIQNLEGGILREILVKEGDQVIQANSFNSGTPIATIADLNKTSVRELSKELKISQEIIDAPPTDGLWDDGRTDEDQIGLTYEELENAMGDENSINRNKYLQIRRQNLHKMSPIPICKFDDD